jgi:hypothetical protein
MGEKIVKSKFEVPVPDFFEEASKAMELYTQGVETGILFVTQYLDSQFEDMEDGEVKDWLENQLHILKTSKLDIEMEDEESEK